MFCSLQQHIGAGCWAGNQTKPPSIKQKTGCMVVFIRASVYSLCSGGFCLQHTMFIRSTWTRIHNVCAMRMHWVPHTHTGKRNQCRSTIAGCGKTAGRTGTASGIVSRARRVDGKRTVVRNSVWQYRSVCVCVCLCRMQFHIWVCGWWCALRMWNRRFELVNR